MTKNDAVERAVTALDRIQLAVKRLGEQSGYNKQTYFEAPILAMPSVQKREVAHLRWMELNDALVACNQASAELQSLQTSRPDAGEADGDPSVAYEDGYQRGYKAAIKSGDKGRWQPISTVFASNEPQPLLAKIVGNLIVWAHRGSWDDEKEGWFDSGKQLEEPTHWMRLPPTSEGV